MTTPGESLVLQVTGGSGDAVVFMKLKDVFPECEFLIGDLPQLSPLYCLRKEGCPRNQNCMDKLVARVQFIFDTFPKARTVVLYFRYRDQPGSHRGGVFWRDMREPRLITFNRAAWEKCKEIGTVLSWRLPDALFLQTGVAGPDRLSTLRLSSAQ